MKLFNFCLALIFSLCIHCLAADKKVLPDSSLYQLQSLWTNDLGAQVHLENLRGKARVLTLFFGHCESSCPMVMTHLKTLETLLPKGWSTQGGIVIVSLDPKRDQVESLSDYRKRMSFSKETWTILRGNEADTRELAMTLGVAYKPSKDNGGMDHNAVVVILDKEGRIVKRYEGAIEGTELATAFNQELKAFSKN